MVCWVIILINSSPDGGHNHNPVHGPIGKFVYGVSHTKALIAEAGHITGIQELSIPSPINSPGTLDDLKNAF